jgi:glycosyltransferase involved in cell wall biosynthesis
MGKLLAILIPTLSERQQLFNRVMAALDKQRVGKNVIIIYSEDSKQFTTGGKRNALIQAAVQQNADYVCFMDDDDLPGETYIQRGIETMNSGLDCGELWGNYYVRGKLIKPFHHSIVYKDWYEEKSHYCRMPNHLNFQKLSLIKDIPFPEQNFGEDGKQSYAMKDAGVFKTEYKIQDIIYHYYK